MSYNEYFKVLFLIAEEELRAANILAEQHNPTIEIICCLCHQSAEKTLKAFIHFHRGDFDFTHNLVDLCDGCKALDNSFSVLIKECHILNPYIREVKYDRQFMVNEFDMKRAIQCATKILEFVREKIGT